MSAGEQMAEGGKQKAGGVPEGWREIVLEDAAEKIMVGIASAATHAYAESGILMIRNLNIKEGWIDKSDLLYITEDYEKTHRNKRIKCGDVLTVRTGYPGVSAVADEALEGAQCFTSLITRPKKNLLESNFLCYYINSSIGKSFILGAEAGGAQKNVNAGSLEKMPLLLPPLPEQRKIVAILSTWDDSLATLTDLIAAKHQQKRGLAEALLTGKKRLPGFEGEWERKKLGDVFTRITRKNTEGNEHALTISGALGLIDQREFFNKRVAAADLSGYYLIRRGEFAYNKSYSAGYAYGAIKRLNRYDAGVVSTLYICFALTQADADSNFYEQFFEAGLLNEGISSIAQEGARNHGLLNVSAKDFFELPIVVPAPAEQKAVAAILTTLDAEIASLEALKAKVQEQKRGLMDELLTGRVRVEVNVEDSV